MRTTLTVTGIAFLAIAFSGCDQPITSPSSDAEFPTGAQQDAASHKISVTTETMDVEAPSQHSTTASATSSDEMTVASPFASGFKLSGSIYREGSSGEANFDPTTTTYGGGDEYVEDPQAGLYGPIPYEAQYTGSQVTFRASDGGTESASVDNDLQAITEQITAAERETYSGSDGSTAIEPTTAAATSARPKGGKKKPKKKDALAYFRDQGYEVRKLRGHLYELTAPMASPLGFERIEKRSIFNTKTMEIESATVYHGGKKKMKHVYKKAKNGKAPRIRTTIYQRKGKPIVTGRKLGHKKKNKKKNKKKRK